MRFPVRSIRTQIILLILIAVLPALGIIIYTGLEQRKEAIERSSCDIRSLTLGVSMQQEQITGSTRQLLMALSGIPAVMNRDAKACDDLLRKLLAQNPCYAFLRIAANDGKVFASAPRITPLSVADRKYFKDVLRTGDFAVGGYVFSRSAGRPVLHFAYPAFDKGMNLVAVIIAAFDVSYYGRYFATASLPDGSALALTDGSGIRLYRYPDFEKYAGKDDIPSMIERMSSGNDEGSFFAQGIDGRNRLYGFKRLHLVRDQKPDMFIRVGVPEEMVLSQANRNLVRNLEIIGLTALLAMGLAYLMGNFAIIRPLDVLVEASRKIGRGDLRVRTGLGDEKSEVGQLARSFDEMASLLEDRESERRWADERIEQLRLEREQVLNSAGEGIIGLNADGDHIFVNPAAAAMLGYEVDELIGRNSHAAHHHSRPDGSPYPEDQCPAYGAYREGKVYHVADEVFWKKDGSCFPVEYTSTPIMENGYPVGAVLTFRDITERIRSEKMLRKERERENAFLTLYEEAAGWKENDLYNFVLELAVSLTDSAIGFMHGVSDDQKTVILTTWSRAALVGCSAPFETHYPIDRAGNWVDCIRQKKAALYNNFSQSPNRKGLPEGHVPIERFMSIPVIEENKVRIIFGVGNKAEDYDDHDVMQIQVIANELNKIIRQRKSDENLRESEELYRTLAEKSMAGVYVVQDGQFKFINTNAASYAGYLPEELIGTDSAALVHPDDRMYVSEAAGEMLHGRGRSPYEFRLLTKDGKVRWIMESVAMIHYDGKPAILGNSMDITGIVQAKRELEMQKELESSILAAIPHAVLGLKNRLIIFASDHASEVFGWVPDELVGKKTRVLYRDEEEYEAIGRAVYSALKERRTHSMECFCRRDDEREIVCRLHASVIGDRLEEGRIVVVYEDISDLKQAEKERQKLDVQLRQAQKMEAIGTLAGGIAHDFNNILGGIIGYTELYKEHVKHMPKVYHGMEEILNASQRAKDLVQQILTFSRQREHEKNPVSVSPILKEVAKFMRASLPATIQIKQKMDVSMDKIMADATQIHQVLMNLCTNAGYAMREKGGILDISLEQVRMNGDILLDRQSAEGEPFLKLTVRDTGCGIKPEHLERIYDPYFTTKEVGEGTGLGLTVVHGIVGNHGGNIKVYSEIGKGTVFYVYLPLLRGQAKTERRQENGSLPHGKETILIVDDEKMLVRVNQLTLEKLGYKVVAETDPVKAIALFKEDHDSFDLVITDKTMPQMTGFELACAVKSIRTDIPIILCSGFQDKGDPEKLSAFGIDHFIVKPISAKAIAEAVRQVLEKKE